MRVVIATAQVPFIRGGAEILADGLKHALRTHGHEVEIVAIPFKWYPPERILEQVLACRLLDLTESAGNSVDLFLGLKFPAYLIPHPNKVLWIVHQHRVRGRRQQPQQHGRYGETAQSKFVHAQMQPSVVDQQQTDAHGTGTPFASAIARCAASFASRSGARLREL